MAKRYRRKLVSVIRGSIQEARRILVALDGDLVW